MGFTKVHRRAGLFVSAIILLSSAIGFASDAERHCIGQADTIEEKLGCLADISFSEITGQSTPQGTRQFEIQFTQLIDHTDSSLGTFQQKLVLTHRNESEPMVLQTSGYSIFSTRLSTLAATFGANQLQIEHRFFAKSLPEKIDWSKLDIKQSADDFHSITVAFKQIYGKRWVGTGRSKGGMTSVYHRRFYPADLDGTVADVAPLSFSTRDQRYNDFINNVGGEAYRPCREKLRKVQVALLENRDGILAEIAASAGTFTQLGNADLAFEHLVIESQFYFWQYGNPDDSSSGCDAIPATGTVADMMAFLDGLALLSDYNDEGLAPFMPYYFQAATQLGSPDNVTSHLERLRRYEYSIDQYTPKGIAYSYSNASMLDVEKWVRTEATGILFVYGEFDPWTAGEFPVSETGKLVRKFYAPKGNHGSIFTSLSSSNKAQAVALISEWMGKGPAISVSKLKTEKLLEQDEIEILRKLHLP